MLLRWVLWCWLNVSFDYVSSILSSGRISKDLETYAFESVSWYFTRKLYKTGDFIFDTVCEWFEVGFTQWVFNCLGAAHYFPSKIVFQLFMGRRFSTPCCRTRNSSIFSLRACSYHWQKNRLLIYINLSLLKQAADDAMQSYKGKSVLQATWYHTLAYARIHFVCSSNFQG